jgi:hypothetical protein
MKKETEKPEAIKRLKPQPERRPRGVRLPGFINEEEIGLGDAIKRVTYAMGVRSCGGCERRATALNRWMTFTR